jgi:DNA-binding transcriptional LysR family regulator
MAIKLAHLRVFVAVATSRNLTEAAGRLCRTPAALSLSLKQLEDEVGGELFVGDRKSQLTPLGRFTLHQAQRELEHFRHTVDAINTYARAETGLVRIASVPSIAITVLPTLIKAFHEQHPLVHLDIRDMDSDSVVRAVSQGDVDIGIGSVPTIVPGLAQHFLLADTFGVICSADNALCKLGRPVNWADLRSQTYIKSGITRSIMEPAFRQIDDASTINVRNTSSLLALVEQGLGVTLLPERLLLPKPNSSLRFLPLDGSQVVRTVNVLTVPVSSLSHAAHAFLKILLPDQQKP